MDFDTTVADEAADYLRNGHVRTHAGSCRR